MVIGDVIALYQRPHHLAFAGGNHPHIEVIGTQIIDDFDHGLIERLSVGHAFKSHHVDTVGEIDHIVTELLRRHAGEGQRDQIVLGNAFGTEGLSQIVCMVSDLFHGVPFFFRRKIGGILQHAVDQQCVVEVIRVGLAEKGTVKVEQNRRFGSFLFHLFELFVLLIHHFSCLVICCDVIKALF